MKIPKPLLLMILDGWGYRDVSANNAIALAKAPTWNHLFKTYPHSLIKCSGEDVGLPPNTMGNSEVGHLNIGAGRIVYQEYTRISKAIRDKTFFENAVFRDCFKKVIEAKGALHVMGLCSDIGVHAHLDHLFAILEFARREGVPFVFVHCFTDGRDSSPTSGKKYLEAVEKKVLEVGNARVATVMGRYYSMDRDKRWDRIAKAYRAIVDGVGVHAFSSEEVMSRSYKRGETDEFVVPAVIMTRGQPISTINDGDGVIFFNFRADRAREITRAIAIEQFDGFQRERVPRLSSFVCMTEYDETFNLPIAFPPEVLANIFGEVISKKGLKQLRIAETEKYAHVTFFFNGGEEKVFPGEERCLIASPRDVPTYDKKPEMSAYLVTDELIRRINRDLYDVIILNYANGDMVGHTGILKAAIKAVEAVDQCIGLTVPVVLSKGGCVIITADHGNCEMMVDEKGGPMTAHTTDDVPLIYISNDSQEKKLKTNGILADIAPTMLEILGVEKPKEMTGNSLFI